MPIYSNEGAILDTRSTYLAKALSLTGLAPGAWGDRFWDFDGLRSPPEGLTQVVGGGAPAHASPVGSKGGVIRLDSSATSGGDSELRGVQRFAGAMNSDKWYMASRQAFPITAAAANSKTGVGASDIATTRSVSMGVYGPLNSSNFVVQYGSLWASASLNLGVAIDTAFHVFEAWSTGDGNINGRIDGGPTVTAAFATAPADMTVLCNAYNNTTANQFQLDVDWMYFAFPRS